MIDDQDKFHIQRRNLLAISVLVIFFELAQVDTPETINLLFTNLKITNPDAVPTLLHIFLLYFMWRYWTAFNDYIGQNKAFEKHNTYLKDIMSLHAYKKAEQKLKKANINFEGLGLGPAYDETSKPFKPLAPKDYFHNKRGAIYKFNYIKIEGSRKSTGMYDTTIEVEISGWYLIWLKFLTLSKHMIFNNLFLEYFFPPFIAILALLETFNVNIATYIAKLFFW